jgi:hypothetical protein
MSSAYHAQVDALLAKYHEANQRYCVASESNTMLNGLIETLPPGDDLDFYVKIRVQVLIDMKNAEEEKDSFHRQKEALRRENREELKRVYDQEMAIVLTERPKLLRDFEEAVSADSNIRDLIENLRAKNPNDPEILFYEEARAAAAPERERLQKLYLDNMEKADKLYQDYTR